jgi:uncharacterized membrane protein YfcA
MRRLTGKESGLSAFIGGFIGGLTLLINNDPWTKKMFALYLLSRAYGSTYTMLDDRGYVPHWLGNQQHMLILIAT